MIRRLRVHGRVQGVWYRGWTVEQARALGLDGWVRNRRDGTVEILASGTDAAVEALVARCHDGPPAAQVERVESEEADEASPPGFAQRPTL
ncbi:MAG TPA: acylphosphatase [Allosphingosinicella sp.]|nr:acylphosphatase [Allosphingosinicella sp.]